MNKNWSVFEKLKGLPLDGKNAFVPFDLREGHIRLLGKLFLNERSFPILSYYVFKLEY